MKKTKGTIGLKLIAVVAAVLLGIGTMAAQQEINPDHFDDNATSHPATGPRTHARNQGKKKQTKQAQAGQKRREDKESQPKKVARANKDDQNRGPASN